MLGCFLFLGCLGFLQVSVRESRKRVRTAIRNADTCRCCRPIETSLVLCAQDKATLLSSAATTSGRPLSADCKKLITNADMLLRQMLSKDGLHGLRTPTVNLYCCPVHCLLLDDLILLPCINLYPT